MAAEPAAAATATAVSASAPGSASVSAPAARTSTLVWPPTHRYAREAQALVAAFKAAVAEDPRTGAGWTVLDTKKEVLISKKAGPTPLGLLRGDGVIAGYTPLEVFPVVTLPTCRKICTCAAAPVRTPVCMSVGS
jgi:hypothetical protein